MTSSVPDYPLPQPTPTSSALTTRDQLGLWINDNRSMLCKVIAARYRLKDDNRIDDIVQEVTITALAELDRGKPISYPYAFFLSTLIPQSVSKAGKAVAKCHAREQKKALETHESDETTPATSAEQRELVLAVRQAIRNMNDDDNDILRGLCEGKTQTQIAEELGVSKTTLNSRLHRSIAPTLRRLLGDFLKS